MNIMHTMQTPPKFYICTERLRYLEWDSVADVSGQDLEQHRINPDADCKFDPDNHAATENLAYSLLANCFDEDKAKEHYQAFATYLKNFFKGYGRWVMYSGVIEGWLMMREEQDEPKTT